MVVLVVVLVLLVADSARPAFEAGESRGGGEERGLLTGYFYFAARRTHSPHPQLLISFSFANLLSSGEKNTLK